MMEKNTTFALFFGNRGFFPASLQASARAEMKETLESLGHKVIMLDARATRAGAVETPAEGERYAQFLRENRGKFGGVILCLPNFGDETGAVAALKEAGVPIMIQAYPDELDKMGPSCRRDSFCGKFSIMDVFFQYGVKFTALQPHTVHPTSPRFAENVEYFDRLCRVANGIKGMVVGAIGARTTAFKTVRIDEVTLQRHGITMETFDLSQLMSAMEKVKPGSKECKAKVSKLAKISCWKHAPAGAIGKLAKLGVVLDQMVKDYGFNALSLRCWTEMQEMVGISPCIVIGEMNDRGIPCACEVDVGNAVTMYALQLAASAPATCLDWNNNYGDDEDKCILFHCGPVPPSLMEGCGCISDQTIIANSIGPNKGFGCNTGRIAATPFTYGSMLTVEGKIKMYLGEGRFTSDPVADDFFGCAGVAEIENLQNVLQTIGYQGHRHHVSCAPGHVAAPAAEALSKYIGAEVARV